MSLKLPIEIAREHLRGISHNGPSDSDENDLGKGIYEYALAVLKYCEPCEKNGEPSIRMKSQYLLLPEHLRSAFPQESLDFFGP